MTRDSDPFFSFFYCKAAVKSMIGLLCNSVTHVPCEYQPYILFKNHFIIHHLVFGINFLLHSVNLILIILINTILVPFTCRLTCFIITTLTIHHFHSFTLPHTSSTNPSHHRSSSSYTHRTCLHGYGTAQAQWFRFSFSFAYISSQLAPVPIYTAR